LALPAWLASIVQLPAEVKVTTPLEMVQLALVVESIVSVTVSPELAVALGV
jgi:hypothetical protein